MPKNAALSFNLNNKNTYFTFIQMMFLRRHSNDCHIEDRDHYNGCLKVITDSLYAQYDKNVNNKSSLSFSQYVQNTYDNIWPDELKFIEKYNDWLKIEHEILI